MLACDHFLSCLDRLPLRIAPSCGSSLASIITDSRYSPVVSASDTAAAGFRDLPVQYGHGDDRQVEGSDRCAKGHNGIGEKLDVALALRNRPAARDELPEEDGRSPENERQDPSGGDHHACHLVGPFDRVAERFGDAEISVKADDEEVHNGGVAHHVVQSQPEVTHQSS